MGSLNFNHLHYFYVVAREGSVVRAGEVLHLTQPTVSGQVSKLERALGVKLFQRAGRNLVLTEAGRLAYGYAEEMFALGREMEAALAGHSGGGPLPLRVGLVDSMPKMMAYRLLAPALSLPAGVRVSCRDGKLEGLLGDLALHKLDVVLSDTPAQPPLRLRVYNHLLGESAVSVFGTAELAERWRPGFPGSLDGAPLLLPTEGTALRFTLEDWLRRADVRPRIVAELEDGALIKAFGAEGMGLFPAPAAVGAEVERQYRVQALGTLPQARARFYAITAERRLVHPAVVALSSTARDAVFAAAASAGEEAPG